MSSRRPDPDQLFDHAVAAARDQAIDPQAMAAARERVARRLEAELDAPAAGVSAELGQDHRIRGCDGFRALIPAYLAGALAEPRRLLFEDHTRECVPCRRALRDARRGGAPAPGWQAPRRRHPALRWAAAAAVIGLTATGALLVASRLGLWGPDASARVRAIEGELQALDGGAVVPLSAGAELTRGQVVRTGRDSGAVLELADGSRVELAQRSELRLARRSDGVVLDLERGALIVAAARRDRGHLYVRTDDCLVSVVGTIFSVHHGVRGSRVSVLDGEVRVRHGVERAVLRPGDQLSTTALLGRVALAREIAWSRNAAEYRELIAALASLGREIDATLAVGGRTSTALLDRAPTDTAIWVGLPNVTDQLSGAWALVEQRVAENPALADWWTERFAGSEVATGVAAALAELRVLGSHLGDEIAIAIGIDDSGHPGDPLILAEVTDPTGLDALLDDWVARINAETGGEAARRIDDPSQAADGGGEGHDLLYVWLTPDGLLAASTSGTRLAELATGSDFVSSPLHQRLAGVYGGGTGWLVGVDASRILRAAADSAPEGAFAALGLADAQHFILESETVEGATETRATLAFDGERSGVAAWLAPPAPSGAIELVSAGASFVVAGLSKNPAEMFEELLAIASSSGGAAALEGLQRLENELGFSLRDDLAASLGGDAAFAIDGPLLPTPSWKLIVEVTNPSHFEYALGRAVEAVNQKAAETGVTGLRFGEEEVDGRRYLTLATAEGTAIATMSFVDGYLVAAPSRALILEAIAHRDAGTTLASSPDFRDLLPSDAETDFSALLWQNMGDASGSLLGLLGSTLDETGREEIEALASELGPALVLAYGDPDRVRVVSRGGAGPFGLSFEKLLTFGGIVLEHRQSEDDDGSGDEPLGGGVTAAL